MESLLCLIQPGADTLHTLVVLLLHICVGVTALVLPIPSDGVLHEDRACFTHQISHFPAYSG